MWKIFGCGKSLVLLTEAQHLNKFQLCVTTVMHLNYTPTLTKDAKVLLLSFKWLPTTVLEMLSSKVLTSDAVPSGISPCDMKCFRFCQCSLCGRFHFGNLDDRSACIFLLQTIGTPISQTVSAL